MFVVTGARLQNGYGILHFRDNPCDQLQPSQLVKAQKMRLCKRCWAKTCKTIVGKRFCRYDCG
eukprot:1229171-Karenia_brevis.AAC.1